MKITYITLIILFITISTYFRDLAIKPPLVISKQESSLTVNGSYLRLIDLGQHRLLSSWFWIKTSIDSDTEHYKKRDENSWMYLRFNLISELEPLFLMNYKVGGQYLSIVKDDLIGAEKILQKGLSFYPEDLWLNYYLGFNYFYELGDSLKALPYFEKILTKKSAIQEFQVLPTLVAKIKAEKTSLDDGYQLLLEIYNQLEKKGNLYERAKETLYALKAERDLLCLNSRQIRCDILDFDGNSYIMKSGTYVAPKRWYPARVTRAKK